MSIFNSVVGKLWMTIIGLVAVVLLILGLFLFQYIDNSLPNVSNQKNNLIRLTNQITEDSSYHSTDTGYYMALSDLLETQDAGIKLVEQGSISGEELLFNAGERAVTIGEVLSDSEITQLFESGVLVSGQFSSTVNPWHGGYLYAAKLIESSDPASPVQAVIVYQSMQSVEDTQIYVKRLFALVSLMGFLMTTFFAFFLITKITRPLTELKKAADSITRGHYGNRVPVVSSDEIGELTRTFNLMGEQLEGTIQDLSHEKQNLASVLHSMEDAVISFDGDGRIIFINPHGERVLEEWTGLAWDEEDLGAEPGDNLTGHIPEPLQELYHMAVEEMKGISSKLHVKNSVWSIVMAPLYAGNQVRGMVAVLRDVTEESRLESLGKDFVANVSHELRTPISMLQGYSEALLDDMVTSIEDRQELVQIIHDESLRMGRLVKDLLDLAKMENGRMEMKFDEVDLAPLLARVQRKFSALCKERGIELVSQISGEDLLLHEGDEDRLEQVMTNLMDNAIRHTSSGSRITIRCGLEQINKGKAVRIDFEDEGEGIPQEALPNIFERFYKADKARTRGAAGGTGLGLAIVKNIVDAHQGTITVSSSLGQGTTFSILLPVERR